MSAPPHVQQRCHAGGPTVRLWRLHNAVIMDMTEASILLFLKEQAKACPDFDTAAAA